MKHSLIIVFKSMYKFVKEYFRLREFGTYKWLQTWMIFKITVAYFFLLYYKYKTIVIKL